MSVTVYAYDNCSTCKKALKWLDAEGITYEKIPIVDQPPSPEVLREVHRQSGLPLKKLFNTSGQSYRNGGWKEKISGLSAEAAYRALAEDGKLIKRPLLLGDGFAQVGFSEAAYAEAFSAR